MKEKETGILKIALISLLICGLIVFTFLLCFSSLPENPSPQNTPPLPNNNPNINDNNNNSTPSLTVPSALTVKLLNTTTTYNYTFDNLGDYSLFITIENPDIAELTAYGIIPKKIGTTKIIASINTTPQIRKETTLTIIDCVRTVNMSVIDTNGEKTDKYFTNTKYY